MITQFKIFEKLQVGDFIEKNNGRVFKIISIHNYSKMRPNIRIKDIINDKNDFCTSSAKKLTDKEVKDYLMKKDAEKYNL